MLRRSFLGGLVAGIASLLGIGKAKASTGEVTLPPSKKAVLVKVPHPQVIEAQRVLFFGGDARATKSSWKGYLLFAKGEGNMEATKIWIANNCPVYPGWKRKNIEILTEGWDGRQVRFEVEDEEVT